tara:strand:+ start:1523 stop:3406 length:1884 start_codon:yes stop_codon:yes gene_type:complete
MQIGEEKISGLVNSATPLSPQHVFLEFTMFPEQTEIALLPDEIEEMQIDLRFQDDLLGLTRPDLKVTILIAQSSTVIDFQGDSNPVDGIDGAYKTENEPLNLEGDRLLWPDEQIRVLVDFDVERPGTWELYLRGSSFMNLDIIWSDLIESRDVDEPSSDAEPRETDFDSNHVGALVGDDRDCWSFEIEEHEVMRATFVWEVVPAEIEQSHGQPDLILPDRRMAPTPELITSSDDSETRLTWQWRALPTGTHTLCIGGKIDAFQPYQWAGVIAFEGIGPTGPDDFSSEALYPSGIGLVGDEQNKVMIESSSGIMVLILSIAIIIGLFVEMRQDSTSKSIRFGLFAPGVIILLAGGVVSPMWAIGEESQSSDEFDLEELIDNRLDQLWHASHPSTPPSSRATHVGATFGMLDGETLQLRLFADYALPLDDGRWQLHVPYLDDLRLDKLIFQKIADKGQTSANSQLLDEHSRSFTLLAARTLLLDLIMLEALLIVDEVPDSNIIHLDMEMENSVSMGTIQDPAWSTKPVDFPEGRWRILQDNLFPSLIVISLCDCELDLLDVLVNSNEPVSHALLTESIGVEPASPLFENQYLWVIVGIALAITAIVLEQKRRNKAKQIMHDLIASNQWV